MLEALKPPALRPGDTIALVSPSSSLADVFTYRQERAKACLGRMGYQVQVFAAKRTSRADDPFAIRSRVDALHAAFADSTVRAIVCTIGGLSANELLPHLDYELISRHPTIFCGYSDISVLHYAIQACCGLVTFYGPMALTQFAEYPSAWEFTTQQFQHVLSEVKSPGALPSASEWTTEVLPWGTGRDLSRPRTRQPNTQRRWLKAGRATGRLIGGCLPSILQLKGTPYDVSYTDRVLFLESPEGATFDTSLSMRQIRSYLADLRNAGVFDAIAGLVVGRPFCCGPQQMQDFEELVRVQCAPYDFPVQVNADIGHTDPMLTLPLGINVTLDSQLDVFSIDEPAVMGQQSPELDNGSAT